ncbi:SpoIVB peptidase [Serpentinicella sp. ANB-PHB4]|uniref:SpoIVB peptidase n=1 Tax=Serpentinicella sp. ANB-PHB4 TaxID=3074076 RepID=UPI002865E8C0|nr:SpoIVB peptidase [Serpentinicella sp. ANB-PHB4]MDR5658180.1 SpoIVB peptidase [Serpentinicella sp. ANB-PHB4]
MIIKNTKKFACIMLIFVLFVTGYIAFNEFSGRIPEEYNISLGNSHILNSRFPFSYSVIEQNEIFEYEKKSFFRNQIVSVKNQLMLEAIDEGAFDIQLKLFGLVPYKNVRVNVVPQLDVIPGGQSIGVRMNTKGVLVVGIADIIDNEHVKRNIGEEHGIKIGDTLHKINDIKVLNSLHVTELLEESDGNIVNLKLERNNNYYNVKVEPIKSSEDGKYRLGLWVRDKTAGVGTLTFYHEESKKFGALGHAITDADTGSLLSVKDGEVIRSKIVSVEQGKKGKPGELKGIFYDVRQPLGKLEQNTEFGVYGEITREVTDSKISSIPIGYQHEVVEGPAYILTTTEDNKVERYDIEIVKATPQNSPSIKSMVIEITDDRLLDKTGGIVQGMSGSPIIQNNKLIGSVTHVLINDPTRGYGLYIEWMIDQSRIFDKIS